MDGASLSLVHTADDFSAISHYRSVIGSYIWVGLRIKAGKKLHCVNATCNGELKWDDNTTFMHDPQAHNIEVDNGGASCFVMDSGDKLDDVNCDRGRNFICQATCSSNCNSTTIPTTTEVACQPPVGYTLITSVDKYYKPVKDKVTWQAAKATCSSEGTILVELRTAAEYQAIRPIYGKFLFRFLYIFGAMYVLYTL